MKPGVDFKVLAPAGFCLLEALNLAARELGLWLTITSASEATWRNRTDPHQTGEAFDVSVRELTPTQILNLYSHLRITLDAQWFTVLYEVPERPTLSMLREIAYVNVSATAPHFHLQRRKGTTYPPPVTPTAATTRRA